MRYWAVTWGRTTAGGRMRGMRRPGGVVCGAGWDDALAVGCGDGAGGGRVTSPQPSPWEGGDAAERPSPRPSPSEGEGDGAGGEGGRAAVLVPTGLLALLPLHATWTEDAERRRQDGGMRWMRWR